MTKHVDPAALRAAAQADWPAEAAHLKKKGAPDFAPTFADAWVSRRISDLLDHPPHLRTMEAAAASFFPNLTSAGWDRADFAEVDRASLRHMLLAAYAAGAQAARERTAPTIAALTRAADDIQREINGGRPVPAATTQRRIRAAITALQDT